MSAPTQPPSNGSKMQSVDNIVLTGFMGTGKTAVGRELARILDMRLVDVDAEIEKQEKREISRIFEESGEAYFRDVETSVIGRLSKKTRQIISTGGGAVLREENMANLRENGVIFCLWAGAGTILERTKGTGERPLLNVADPLSRIKELLDFRSPYYERAGILIDTEGKTPLQVAKEIAEMVRCRK